MRILDMLDKFAKDNNLVLCGILLLVAAFVLSFCYRDRIIKGPRLRFGGTILFFCFWGAKDVYALVRLFGRVGLVGRVILESPSILR